MIQNWDTIIVGAGLFGQIIAKKLEVDGERVICIDSSEEGAGSKAAACLMKPSWASSLTSVQFANAINLLDELYGVHKIPFILNGLVDVDLYWVPPYKILSSAKVHFGKVLEMEQGHNEWLVHLNNHPCLNAKRVIVAAGKWSNIVLSKIKGGSIYQVPKLTSKVGVAFVGQGTCSPKMKVWAPYKQLVAFNRAPDQIWVGDGTALKPESMTVERAIQSERRCAEYVDKGLGDLHAIAGHRPYADIGDSPCYFKELTTNLFVATGGAKNGTLSAAWVARQL